MQPSDAELVRSCLSGDTEAFGELVERYQGAVYATAFHYVGPSGAVEDIAQDAFLAGYRGLPQLKDPTRFGPWLREITSRTASNWLRKNSVRHDGETPLPYRRRVSIEEVQQGPAHVMERNERFKRIQSAIDSLPEQYRLVITLRYLQELSYEEIAQFTGLTRGEVRGQLYRASRMLRKALAGIDSGEGETGQWHRVHK